MPAVLSTGAAGFIGSHLSDWYLAQGWRVIGIDNLVTGSRENLTEALRSPHFELLERDITTTHRALIDDLRAKYEQIDLILHFASHASPVDYTDQSQQTLAVNSKGTELCAQA